jgi:hypothetical protein
MSCAVIFASKKMYKSKNFDSNLKREPAVLNPSETMFRGGIAAVARLQQPQPLTGAESLRTKK